MADRTPRARHPSGRPFRRAPVCRLSIVRAPRDEPLTPGLRRDQPEDAIGFLVPHLSGRDDEDDE